MQAVYMTTLVSLPVGYQMVVPFLSTRSVFELRERMSGMYSWTTLSTAQILGEVLFHIVGSTLHFLTWYWTVGFPTDRAGYTYLLLGVAAPIHTSTTCQAVAAVAADSAIAKLLTGSMFSFAIIL